MTQWKLMLAATGGAAVLLASMIWDTLVPDFYPTETLLVAQTHTHIDVTTAGYEFSRCDIVKDSVSGYIMSKNKQWRKTEVVRVEEAKSRIYPHRVEFQIRIRAWDWIVRYRDPTSEIESSIIMYYVCSSGDRTKLGPAILATAS